MENQDPIEDNLDPNVEVNPEVKTPEVGKDVSWYDALDADLKSNPSITKFKEPKELAKSYVELQKLIGKDKIVIPTEKSTPQEWNEFYKKVGRPETVNDYAVPDLELAEEVKMRQESLEAFKAKAHELGLTKKQFAELYGLQADLSQKAFTQQVEEAQKMKETTETALRGEWGAAFEKKVDSAQKLINTYFKGKEMHKAFSVLANDKGFVQAMSEIAERLGEDVIGGTARMTLTPKEAQSELNRIIGDDKGAYFDELHPEHDEMVNRVIELQRMANG